MYNSIKVIALIFRLLAFTSGKAQVGIDKKSFTYGEFKAGYAVSQLGKNLKERYEAGNYSTTGGAQQFLQKLTHLTKA